VAKTQSRRKTAGKSAPSKGIYVARHRQRLKRNGLRRMEVAVKPRDVPLIKSIVSTLCADGTEAEQLREKIQPSNAVSKLRTGADLVAMLKRLAPLADEVDLTHRDNIYRPVVEFD